MEGSGGKKLGSGGGGGRLGIKSPRGFPAWRGGGGACGGAGKTAVGLMMAGGAGSPKRLGTFKGGICGIHEGWAEALAGGKAPGGVSVGG